MKRTGMIDIKDILRHRHDLGLPRAQIAAAVGVSAGTVSHILDRASAAGLSWPLPADLDDDALRARLYPPSLRDSGHVQPDWDAVIEALKAPRKRNLTRMQRLRTCAAWRPDTAGYRDPVVATKLSLKSLARRILDINDEIAELDRFIVPLVEELAPSLLELEGVGTENAGAVMVAVGDNPDRLRSEASFAMMCGVCPIPASSGKTQRHRLNRGGNRQANSALHMVVVCRMRTDERTRAYVARRTLEGLSKREIMRCLKRYVAREIYRVLTAPSSA